MPVELTRIDEFALITLNRPEALNALSFQIVREIGEAIDEVARSDARALLFTGTGDKAFCAGADISELMGRSVSDIREGARRGQCTFSKLDELYQESMNEKSYTASLNALKLIGNELGMFKQEKEVLHSHELKIENLLKQVESNPIKQIN